MASKCGAGTYAIAFDAVDPEAVAWARERSGALIREVTDETLRSVRVIITRAFTEGMPPRTAARLIRNVVGLTERQTQSTLNFRGRLLEKAAKLKAAGKRAPTSTVIEERTRRYTAKLIRRRALVIARTETIAAANEGQRRLWLQAVKKGFLKDTVQREWITTPDDRLCERCAPMDEQRVGLGELFKPETGKGVMSPPLHPNCRCAVALSVKVVAPARKVA